MVFSNGILHDIQVNKGSGSHMVVTELDTRDILLMVRLVLILDMLLLLMRATQLLQQVGLVDISKGMLAMRNPGSMLAVAISSPVMLLLLLVNIRTKAMLISHSNPLLP
jgi:hypothetical protein